VVSKATGNLKVMPFMREVTKAVKARTKSQGNERNAQIDAKYVLRLCPMSVKRAVLHKMGIRMSKNCSWETFCFAEVSQRRKSLEEAKMRIVKKILDIGGGHGAIFT